MARYQTRVKPNLQNNIVSGWRRNRCSPQQLSFKPVMLQGILQILPSCLKAILLCSVYLFCGVFIRAIDGYLATFPDGRAVTDSDNQLILSLW